MKNRGMCDVLILQLKCPLGGFIQLGLNNLDVLTEYDYCIVWLRPMIILVFYRQQKNCAEVTSGEKMSMSTFLFLNKGCIN